MGKITYRILTDPNDPIFKRGMIVSHPDFQRDLAISIAASRKNTGSMSRNIFRGCDEPYLKEESKDSTS